MGLFYISIMPYKGYFSPTNPSKYMGNPTQIVYRSMWERRFMKFCDTNQSVLRWGSEEVVIPYISPLDRKPHRYFVDFIVEMKTPEGGIKTMLIEVKPKKQCCQPKKPKRQSRNYICEMQTWITNSAKWKAAKEAAQSRGWEFRVLTEDDLFKNKK